MRLNKVDGILLVCVWNELHWASPPFQLFKEPIQLGMVFGMLTLRIENNEIRFSTTEIVFILPIFFSVFHTSRI